MSTIADVLSYCRRGSRLIPNNQLRNEKPENRPISRLSANNKSPSHAETGELRFIGLRIGNNPYILT